MSSTTSVSGLASGFDWRSMVDQLMEVEHGTVDLMTKKQSQVSNELSEWRSLNTRLLALKTAAENLTKADDFYDYSSTMSTDSSTVDAEDLVSVSTSSTALSGTYNIKVEKLATAQKLSSTSFTDSSTALGSGYEGEILLNGKVVSITASDTLKDVRDKINNANSGSDPSGITASIVSYGTNDTRLVITSEATGEDGMGIANGSASDLIEKFGFVDSVSSVKTSITGGAQSDQFDSSTQAIKSIFGLSANQSGSVTIGGTAVAIDLSSDSLESIKNKINSAGIAGVSASIVSQTDDDGNNLYRLQIDGTQTFTDDQNILETIGVLQKGVSSVTGTTSANAMTSEGSVITASTLLSDIDGYNTFTAGDSIDITGTDHSGGAVNTSFTITASSTVQDFLDAVESAFGDVNAYITSDGKIEVADQISGASSLSVSLASNLADGNSTLDFGAFSALDTVRERQLVAGSDAEVSIDGVTVSSSDNIIDDVLAGVTIDLKKADTDTTISLTIGHDYDSIISKIENMVGAYNDVAAFITDQQTYDEENDTTGGPLFGDGTLSSIKRNLTSVLIESVWGVNSEYSTLGLVGISVDTEGQLSIDEGELRGYLETNFNEIRDLFVARGTTDTGSLTYVTSDRNANSGDYAVFITQAATQSTATSENSYAGALGADETITVTDGDKVSTVDLTSTMTLSDAVNALNTDFDTEYTQTLASGNAVLSGGLPASSSLTWDSIDGASMVDGDTINFSGTSRGGSTVQGSYTISDVTTDTLQDFLAEIESVFGDEVNAGVDSEGRIVVTDRTSGNSNLSLTIEEPVGRGLDFGTVESTNDGGTTGRYALEVTASVSASNELVITHDYYGSGNTFEISETADLFWTGDQTVDNGQDVAGTINGESASGKGQVLTGDEDEPNVDGLVIKYTGTDSGVEVGNIKLTLGIAELFNRTLFSITDDVDGYLTAKTESLEDRIDSYDERIEKMETRLTARMQTMINRFIAMELALSEIQNQGDWLTSQLSSLSR
ncbi:Flagellar hook-associated 2 domain protein [Desulfatibacillum aliphaticivorans]|uniref:Filament cap protein n=1 Tax=Desulfatibacillum aliphaticivorans TaxID=218208 RepID=B8FJS1_DESAL|nr:flagellar filament capping protein FliD [Desulfatibacillum aliphaticivorans]ACL02349.1 Flagellar hook-associated 2 domain protein [Desulfatibacillum aliphaticivorans]